MCPPLNVTTQPLDTLTSRAHVVLPQAARTASGFVATYEDARLELEQTVIDLPQLVLLFRTQVCVPGAMCLKNVLRDKLSLVVSVIGGVRDGAGDIVNFFATFGDRVASAIDDVKGIVTQVSGLIKVGGCASCRAAAGWLCIACGY